MKITLKMPVGELIKFLRRQARIHGKNITMKNWIKFMEGDLEGRRYAMHMHDKRL